MISSFIPFPPVSWWQHAVRAGNVTFDLAEHYQKMSYRNRYYLASPEGKTLMSIPLAKGRNQRVPVAAVCISGDTPWQSNHWKTITSLYGRSPFFPYFEHLLRPLFERPYTQLHTFNRESIRLVSHLLRLELTFTEITVFRAQYPPETRDLRQSLNPQHPADIPEYYQVFSERTGFLPDCSILDLLFCEGPYAAAWLQQ